MHFIKKFYLPLIWALLSLFACGVNGKSLPVVSFDIGIDKLAHFLLFGMQAWLIIFAQYKSRKSITWPMLHWAVALSIVYGIILEGMQATVFINRSYDYADMLANAAGALLCYPLALYRFRLK